MTAERVDALVIGAGVVGLAVARALAHQGREVLVLEAAESFGTGTSSRNSEVVHAGIYYPAGSLKARFCVAGRERLYAFCAERGVEHRRCGKLIVATDDAQRERLAAIRAKGEANGVRDLRLLDRAEALAMEPALDCVAALHSPSSGIVDSHGFMLALLGDAESRGAVLATHAPVTGGSVGGEGIQVEVGGAEPMALLARTVVNAAGLEAQAVSMRLGVAAVPPLYLAKGNYYALQGRSPFARLVYPVPEPGGLGVHLTIDLGGQARFGPDVEWVESPDYHVDPARAERFYAAIRRYWPGLPDGALVPAYAGIRPKIVPAGSPDADFLVQGERDHGVSGLVCLYGIESPGLTSALALAEHVAAMCSM